MQSPEFKQGGARGWKELLTLQEKQCLLHPPEERGGDAGAGDGGWEIAAGKQLQGVGYAQLLINC